MERNFAFATASQYPDVWVNRFGISWIPACAGMTHGFEQRGCIEAVGKLWGKYAVTTREIEAERDETSERLQGFIPESAYE